MHKVRFVAWRGKEKLGDIDPGQRLSQSEAHCCHITNIFIQANDICHGYVVETVPTLSNIEHINNNHEAADNRFFVGFITLDISLNENKTFNTIEINRYKLTNSPYSKPKILPSPTTVEYRRFRK